MKKIITTIVTALFLTVAMGVLSACGGGDNFRYVNFAAENGYTMEEKTYFNTSMEENRKYWEVKQDTVTVAYITSTYYSQGKFGLIGGRMSLNVYIPYCDVTDFVVNVDGAAVDKGEMDFEKPWGVGTFAALNRTMPHFYINPETKYKNDVAISFSGLDPEVKREVEVKLVLSSSPKMYFAVNDGTESGIIEVTTTSQTALRSLGYDVTIASELLSMGENTFVNVTTATFKLFAGNTFTYYSAKNSTGMIKATSRVYIGGSAANVLKDSETITESNPQQEGLFYYETSIVMTFPPSLTTRQVYKVSGAALFDVYYME